MTIIGLPKRQVESLNANKSVLDLPNTMKSVTVGVGASEMLQDATDSATSQPTLLEAILSPQTKAQTAKPLGAKATVPKVMYKKEALNHVGTDYALHYYNQ